MDCVYDKGYVGLSPDLPAIYDNTYVVTPEVKEPAKTDGPLAQPASKNNPPIVFPQRRRLPFIRITIPPIRINPPRQKPTTPREGTTTTPKPRTLH